MIGDNKKTVIITGASSGLGLSATRELLDSGDWHVIMAVRDPEKAEAVAKAFEFPEDSYTIEELELESFESVRRFAKRMQNGRQPDVLVCNAALYLPASPEAQYTDEGYERSMQVNHLSHFLLLNLMMPVSRSSCWKGGGEEGVIYGIYVQSIFVKFDSKLANMMTILEAHRRYNDKTGITFNTLYPGRCIAETALFRDKKPWFRKLFPLFMKYVTGGYVSEPEAGERLAQVVSDPMCKKSGVYWGWNGGEIFENEPSAEVQNPEKAKRLWELSARAVGLPYDEQYYITCAHDDYYYHYYYYYYYHDYHHHCHY
eukprot:jgi/Bigna1/53786/estExt_Genewise1Plus.C_240075